MTTFESEFSDILENQLGPRFARQENNQLAYRIVKDSVMPVVINQLKKYHILLDSVNDFEENLSHPWQIRYIFWTTLRKQKHTCDLIFMCRDVSTTSSAIKMFIIIEGTTTTEVVIDDVSEDGVQKGLMELFKKINDDFLEYFTIPKPISRGY